MITLLSNASTTGDTIQWSGGIGTLAVEGTFGGATVTLQKQGPNGTWISVGELAALTEAGFVNVEISPGNVRALVAGGTPSALYAILEPFSIG